MWGISACGSCDRNSALLNASKTFALAFLSQTRSPGDGDENTINSCPSFSASFMNQCFQASRLSTRSSVGMQYQLANHHALLTWPRNAKIEMVAFPDRLHACLYKLYSMKWSSRCEQLEYIPSTVCLSRTIRERRLQRGKSFRAYCIECTNFKFGTWESATFTCSDDKPCASSRVLPDWPPCVQSCICTEKTRDRSLSRLPSRHHFDTHGTPATHLRHRGHASLPFDA